ncbi:uncharacterized protein LOC134222022 [Armigeres subalbatus]|uniref:uncharacterized protein LOC134222022 n=1 Tax=Armigeres subalbatus TaxID=124917 RepID=UPI002ED0271A
MFKSVKSTRRIEDSDSSADEACGEVIKDQVDVVETEEEELQESNSDTDNSTGDEVDNQNQESESSSDGGTPDTRLSRPPSKSPPADVAKHNDSSHPALDRTNADRIDRMEEMIANMNNFMNRFEAHTRPAPTDNDDGWKSSNDVHPRGSGENSSSSIRWDHLKPFPSGIAANKMWEEFNRYVENFEIAASLNNVNDPVKRSQQLFLSIGDELQAVA